MKLGEFETNNIYLGDCYELIKKLPDKSVDLVIIDPPYEFCAGGNGSSEIAQRKFKQKEEMYSLDTKITKKKMGTGYQSGGGCFGTKNRSYHSQLCTTDVSIARQKYLEYVEKYGVDEESERLSIIANAVDNRENTSFISEGFSNDILDELVRVMKKVNIYIWCSKAQISQILNYFEGIGCNIDLLTWHKCLSGSTEIIVKNDEGYIYKTNLKDFYRNKNNVNSFIFNGEDWVKIYNVVKYENHKGYNEIVLRNGNTIKCSLDHKFYVNAKEIEAQDLKIGDILDHHSIKIKEVEHSKISNNLAWFIGLFIAQGSYSSKGSEFTKTIQIATNRKRDDIVKKIDELCLEYNATYNVYEYGNNQKREIHIFSSLLNGVLKEYISGKLSYGKHLSNKCWNMNKEFLDNLLQGYLDGDGYYDNHRYRLGFTRKNYNLKNDLITICNILNYNIKIQKTYASFNNKKYAIFKGTIYKYNKNIQKSDYEIVKIKTLKDSYIDLYDIQLNDEKHKFLLSDGTITHNCNPIPTCNNTYLSDTEYCIFARESGVKLGGSVATKKKYYVSECNVADKKLYDHPTIKPLHIIKNLIINSSEENEIVLDTFLGSGTTAVACKELNRQYIGFELNEEFYEIAKNRLEGLTQEDRKKREQGQISLF